MFVPWIDWDVAMRIDEKSLLAHIAEQVAIVQTITFLPGSSVDVCVVQEEDDFFFFHTALSCSGARATARVAPTIHGSRPPREVGEPVVLEAPPILVLHFQMEGRLLPPGRAYPKTLSILLANFVNRAINNPG